MSNITYKKKGKEIKNILEKKIKTKRKKPKILVRLVSNHLKKNTINNWQKCSVNKHLKYRVKKCEQLKR